jgi:hypothetical protein
MDRFVMISKVFYKYFEPKTGFFYQKNIGLDFQIWAKQEMYHLFFLYKKRTDDMPESQIKKKGLFMRACLGGPHMGPS